jgi:hypothetical protein
MFHRYVVRTAGEITEASVRYFHVLAKQLTDYSLEIHLRIPSGPIRKSNKRGSACIWPVFLACSSIRFIIKIGNVPIQRRRTFRRWTLRRRTLRRRTLRRSDTSALGHFGAGASAPVRFGAGTFRRWSFGAGRIGAGHIGAGRFGAGAFRPRDVSAPGRSGPETFRRRGGSAPTVSALGVTYLLDLLNTLSSSGVITNPMVLSPETSKRTASTK